MVIRLPGQGPVPSASLELGMELFILCHIKLNIPLGEDVSGVHVLFKSFPHDLKNEPSGIVGLLRSGGGRSSFSGGHLHQNKQKKRSETGFVEN